MAAVIACALALAAVNPAVAQPPSESGGFTVVRASVSGEGEVTFTTDDVSGSLESPGEVVGQPAPLPDDPSAPGIDRPSFDATGNLIRLCGCSNEAYDFEPVYNDIRSYSDRFMASGNERSKQGLSNLVWAWGQFIDHDVVATVDLDEHNGKRYDIQLEHNGRKGTMKLFRLDSDPAGVCRAPKVVNTPIIDAGPVYGPNEEYLQETLREPGSCKLRVSRGDFLPVTTKQDPKTKKHLFVAGDPRVNEHAVLTAMHTIFMREHNRICTQLMGPGDEAQSPPGFGRPNPLGGDDDAADSSFDVDNYFDDDDDDDAAAADAPDPAAAEDAGPPQLSADQAFDKARKIVTAKMQQITAKHFLPALGLSFDSVKNYDPAAGYPDISVEFQIAYRFGHDMIPDKVGRFDTVGLFDGEEFFRIRSARGSISPGSLNFKMDRLLSDAGSWKANEIDGKFSSALRNSLFGMFGEDLASRNLFRGRELGVPGYTELARCFGTVPNEKVGAETNDAFLGLLRENQFVGDKIFGPTLTAILTDQFHRILFGPQGSWWEDDMKHDLTGFEDEIRETTLASVINANTMSAKVSGNGFTGKR